MLAGPGAGKTEVVTELVRELCENAELDPDEIWVVAFSNAAVHAAADRLRAARLRPSMRTLDALATLVLAESGGDLSGTGDFDARVAAAIDALDDPGWDGLEEVRHIVVDEAQDVVGVRAEFVQALLNHAPEDVGFTVLGDPAQAIYGFAGDGSGVGESLIDQVSAMSHVRSLELEGEYRSQGREPRSAIALRDSVLAEHGAGRLWSFRAQVPIIGDAIDLPSLLRRWAGRTVVLTRTNGEALLVAEALHAAGLRVLVRRSARQQVLAPWPALVLGRAAAVTINRAEFDAHWREWREQHQPLSSADVDEAWRQCRQLDDGRGADLHIGRLARELARRSGLHPVFLDEPDVDVIVSTVHRAKGLEFENVVVVDQAAPQVDVDPVMEVRVTYVALSRARQRIARLRPLDEKWLRKSKGEDPRWYVSGHKKWMVRRLELRNTDLDRRSDVSRAGTDDLMPLVGVNLDFRLDPDRSSLRAPVYQVNAGGRPIGHTSLAFGESLAQLNGDLTGRRRSWPGLRGGYVESLITVASDPGEPGAGSYGLKLSPAMSGLVTLVRKESDE